MSYLKHLTLGVSVAALLTACSQPAADDAAQDSAAAPAAESALNDAATAASDTVETESDRLNAWFQQVFDEGVAESPMYQTFLGMKTNYDQWDDPSPEEELRQYERGREQHAYMLANFDFDALDRSAQISWRLAEYNNARAEAGRQWTDHGYTFTPRSGPHMNTPTFMINNHRVDTLEDAEAYIGRLRNMGAYLDQHIANSRRSAELGVYTPRWTYQPMIATSRNIITGAPFDESGEDSPLMGDFRRKVTALELSEEDTNRLLDEAAAALTEIVAPAYGRIIALFEEQEAVANDDDGVWKHPQGDEYYNHLLNGYTTMDISAEEIHQLGVAEVDRIHNEMRAIMTQVGFEGSLQDFFEFMRTDEQFYYPNTDEGRDAYLADATAMIDTMVETLPQMFNRFPQAELEVRRVEPFRENAAGKAFYQRPAANGSRPGIYYANLRDMAQMPSYQMEALAYHEGAPGHHMQLAIMQELEGIPAFRRFGGYTAYTEGWGLYTEYFPLEFGFYSDPYSNFGRLAMELWRACRLVVDTGLHHHQWTRQEAVDYLMENTPNPEGDAINAIDRYIVFAGQATAYKIGMLEILRLRGIAEEELGEDYDIREFHDVILREGALPLSILAEQVRAYIAETGE
ncbi:MAG: DUF885 domain-containing protein [Maricaulis sp.]|uniref:DUF885 domain-containing protein n=1 Tax=Maricaulis sp. TaxID=1486257 RepID=UPI001B2C0C92|nr:DUF885 domain-containing protein [Maricaulis sp.]MBO6730692.1 DUF885 domain-containing protein [Maricaulis sp.]MBO6847100.1 DUF885 domain-containing protein [Maricaulis sp.]MBO6877331.1 DUF885 domain-containing protein [Maricaulis sp.]